MSVSMTYASNECGRASIAAAVIAELHANNRGRYRLRPLSAISVDATRTTAMIKKLNFVAVPTSNQDAALAFWTEKMGLKIATDRPMGPGQRWIELTIPGAQTAVVLHTRDGQEDRVGTFFNGSFACDDVDYAYEVLQARGVEFTSPPEKQPWGTFAQFKDPDGNTFVLSSR
jgi:predicted enzyme related to lactoylglutathione lyase